MTRAPCLTASASAAAARCRYSTADRQQPPRQHPPIVLSGIQPTGTPHLGNYLGAVRQWSQLQHSHPCVLYSIVDLHALTAHPPVAPAVLRQSIRDTAALLLAAGIDPAKSALFQQSHVPAHANLAWVLTCLSSAGWLARMTQWKAKAGGGAAAVASEQGVPPGLKMGLFSYPVLMAADILVYQATHIPVGDDQLQHLELARLIAKTFNSTYKTDLFPMPQAITLTSGKRIMSLTDPTSKMSKSAPSDSSRIHLTDSNDVIVKKIRRAVTDSAPTITFDTTNRPASATCCLCTRRATIFLIQQA
ncbi:Aminoacyl-tRNA synthetase [Catenaria anguillulae PL171]|uniref:tryptophan--tRNA ligase n=1 Tax=Catenaria anguillulae PL171 TaxID=765915 RepID=A0A1Y2HA81_9FUNG|nr:Aminoacyl-tRNA synthetase [Catenaria anguillulae PL171]